jgi:hypothetical protein
VLTPSASHFCLARGDRSARKCPGFACQGRAVCSACDCQHTAEAAARLVDHVSPPVPVRRWVISLPKGAVVQP